MQAVALAAHAALRARCALQGPEREQQLSNMTAQDGIADLLCVMLQQAELRPLLLARGIEADILALVPDMLVRLVCRTLQFLGQWAPAWPARCLYVGAGLLCACCVLAHAPTSHHLSPLKVTARCMPCAGCCWRCWWCADQERGGPPPGTG